MREGFTGYLTFHAGLRCADDHHTASAKEWLSAAALNCTRSLLLCINNTTKSPAVPFELLSHRCLLTCRRSAAPHAQLPLDARRSSVAVEMMAPTRSYHRADRCMCTKPAALLACVFVTVVWLWLTAHPLIKSPMHVHALSIDVDAANAAQPHPLAGVLIDPRDDADAVASWQTIMHHLHHQRALPDELEDPSAIPAARPPFSCYGVQAVRGRRRYMEDTHAIYLDRTLHYSNAKNEHLVSRDEDEADAGVAVSVASPSPWALFGVYDGHGGAVASEHVAAYLLPSLHSALQQHGFAAPISQPAIVASEHIPSALNLTACFAETFQQLDREFLEFIAAPQHLHDGSTALVAGVHYSADAAQRGEPAFQLVVANAGDCRAILVQQNALAAHDGSSGVLALSFDHKPELAVERAWIESHRGGFVSGTRGGRDLPRVQGVLATSRAIGDRPLKPWVRSEPDVKIVQLEDLTGAAETSPPFASCPFEAELPLTEHQPCGSAVSTLGVTSPLLLLASDGFWDVFENAEAGAAALDFLHRHASTAAVPGAEPLLSALAHHLVAEAYLRGSMDNLTVMAIDLQCVQRWLREQANAAAAALVS